MFAEWLAFKSRRVILSGLLMPELLPFIFVADVSVNTHRPERRSAEESGSRSLIFFLLPQPENKRPGIKIYRESFFIKTVIFFIQIIFVSFCNPTKPRPSRPYIT